jgi:hypothetical protein
LGVTLLADLDAFYLEHEHTAANSTAASTATASGWRVARAAR